MIQVLRECFDAAVEEVSVDVFLELLEANQDIIFYHSLKRVLENHGKQVFWNLTLAMHDKTVYSIHRDAWFGGLPVQQWHDEGFKSIPSVDVQVS